MLVLGRKQNETIIVNGNIRIQVVGISGNTVRLGIDAPRDISIMRGELVNKDRFKDRFAESAVAESAVAESTVAKSPRLEFSVDCAVELEL